MNFEELFNSGATIKLEISPKDLLSLASALIKYGEDNAKKDSGIEPLLTGEEVCAIVRRDRTTLSRWHKDNVLRHNELGLYKKADVLQLINK